MGSATVVYEKEEDASKAIEEYHGATLDERLLTVEYDLSALARKAGIASKGKTLRVGDRILRK
jgi:RNA recognition motif-containing protein